MNKIKKTNKKEKRYFKKKETILPEKVKMLKL